MSDAPTFMQSPLAVWVQTFSFEPVSYKDLVDGIYLNEVLLQIDPKSSLEGIKNNVEDSKDKMVNWELLLKNIRSFYQDVLDYYIVTKPPNIYSICTHPESELARHEVQKSLHLLLGCAINCEMKEGFIEGITSLPEDIQVSMMGYIQELQDINSNVIGSRLLSEDFDGSVLTLYGHLTQLIKQRDEYLQEIKSLRLTIDEADFDQSFLNSISIVDNGLPEVINRYSQSVTTAKSHKNRLVVELAECKARLRKLRHDLEDRDDAVSELEIEVDSLKLTVQKLKNENLELTRDARAIKSFQDELDIVREKASRCERLESEVQRYKEKLVDLDFYKSRVEELRQDNSALFDNRSVMEEQLKAAHKRIEAVMVLESELQKYKEQRDALILECDRHRIQAQNLVKENARLESERQASADGRMEDELQVALNSMHKDSSNSLYDQLSQAAHSQVLKLELENQRLKQDLEQIRENTMLENASKTLALEKENSRLAAKVDKFLETSRLDDQRCQDLKHTNEELTRDKKDLEETIEVLKETSERQVKEFEKETSQLSQMIQSLRERSEKTNDLRIKDLESENQKLNEKVKEFIAQVSQLEHERRSLNRRSRHFQDEAERSNLLEMENRKLESTNDALKRTVESLQLSNCKIARLESELSTLDIENQKLVRTVETLQKSASKKEKLELENSSLTSELHSLKENLGSATQSLTRVDALEKETKKLNLQLEQSVEQYKIEKLQRKKFERENSNLNAEKQQNLKSLSSAEERIRNMEQALDVQENHNAELVRKIEDLKRSNRRLEDVETLLKDLESETERVKKEKSVVNKENKKLKQNLLAKESTIDDLASKLTELDLEIKTLAPLIERNKELEFNLSELEKENLGVIQSATVDKKTIGTLREDLVNEKIRCQQLQTDLENLRHQLTSAAVTNEKSLISRMTQEEGSFKNLESKMEDVYEKRINSQEEQIRLLEKKVDEYKSQAKKLQLEVEGAQSPTKERTLVVTQRYSNSPSATQDIINLKDHIIKIERLNATLEEENRNIKRQNSELQEHIKQLQSQISMWQSQLLAFQTQLNNLQSQLATTEVENRTLLSENASLSSQNSLLQDQCSRTEALVTHLQRQHEEFLSNHEALEKDLGKLQSVHDQLAAEHEALIVKHASLKDVYRGSKLDVKHLQQRCSELTREKEMIAQLKMMLERDKENLKSESQHLESLQSDYIHVREDNLRLLNANDKVNGELQERHRELRLVKADVLQLKAKMDELMAENAGLNKQIGDRNAEYSKQVFRLEETMQWASKLEEENQSLMVQMKLLISQNQDLLTKLLESKDQHIFEQKAYLERLAELRQQKEKLEERFMEQHKRYDPVKNKHRSITATFVKKAKQMIKGKSRENVNAGGGLDGSGLSDTLENTSCGSGSVVPSSDGMPLHDYSDVPLSTSVGFDSRSQPRQNKISSKRNSIIGNISASNPVISSKEISTNTAAGRDDNPITLDEFLSECNQSPKSRRKLLVEKQVALDENIDSVSDITKKPLRPRRPTIREESTDNAKVLLKSFRSEMNISSHAEPDQRRRTLPGKTSFESSPMLSTPNQAGHPRVRPVIASRSVIVPHSEFVGKGIDQQQMQWTHQNAQGPKSAPIQHFGQSVDPTFSEQASGSRRSRPIRSQSCYESLSAAASPQYHEAARSGCVPNEKDDCPPARHDTSKRPSSSSLATRESEAYSTHSRSKPRDQPYGNVDQRPVSHRPESARAENQQHARGHQVQDQQFMPPNRSQDPDGSDDPGSQYNPGNVRNLVHSFQQVVKPSAANSPLHSTPKEGRTNRPRSAAPNSSAGQGNPGGPTARVGANAQSMLEDRVETGVANPKSESNVCVVRPASGRALPSHMAEPLNPSDCRIGSKADSTAVPADGASTSRPSSAKGAKPKVFLDYGLL